MFPLSWVRAQFPALEAAEAPAAPWALLDNAGGSVTPRPVIERVHAHLARRMVQVGASYPLSRASTEAVDAGKAAAARLLGAEVDEVVLGASTTANLHVLATAVGATLAPGDELVVTDLDHECNIGAWRRLERLGAVVREWRLRPGTARLHVEDLLPLLGPRTRVVAFTQGANVVGLVHPLEEAVAAARAVGALTVVDGVAVAPHRLTRFRELGADVYLVSLYKVFGPHLGAMVCRRDLLARLPSQNHFFLEAPGAYRLMPGGVSHELCAGLPGIEEYLLALDAQGQRAEGTSATPPSLSSAFARIAAHERALTEQLLAGLRAIDGLALLGGADVPLDGRLPLLAFTLRGRRSAEVVAALDEHRVALRWGHFYAHRAMVALGLPTDDGVVRASLAHYNTADEIDRALHALRAVAGPA